jgi:hypothetical protein
MRPRTFAAALGIAFAAGVLGMAGAGAFNPDDGLIAHVDVLWRFFGVIVYLGVLAIPVIVLTGLIALLMHAFARRDARRA